MFTASFYFLGLATCILATSVCFSRGKRAGRCVEVELDTLRAASVCLPTGRRVAPDGAATMLCTATAIYKGLTWDEKAKWTDMKAMWVQWYHRCQEKATLKQKAMYSWARTMALCAMLCLMGVLLEAEFDQPITLNTVLSGFRDPRLAGFSFPYSPFRTPQRTPASATDRALRN
jgi:hypothetical protein